METGCPLTMYTIYYREIPSGDTRADWPQIRITQLNMTSHIMRLQCDKEYEIAMSAQDEEKESGLSNSWRVKTKSTTTGIYLNMF